MDRIRRRRRRVLLVLLPLLLAAVFLLYFRYTPYVREAARIRVVNVASDWIIDSVNEALRSGVIDFDGMTYLEKDVSGNITAVRTNTAEMNLLKSEIMDLLSRRMLDIDTQELTVPLGNILLPEYFAGRGARLPVRVVALSSSDATFCTEFEQSGINQTVQRVKLNIRVTLTVVTPAGAQDVDVDSDVIVAETVIVGTVPNSYVNFNAPNTER